MTTILNALALIGGLSLLAILVSICIFGRALSRLGRDLGEDREVRNSEYWEKEARRARNAKPTPTK